MLFPDLICIPPHSFPAYRLRSFLTGLDIAIGIAAVILPTAIGEGLLQFVFAELSAISIGLAAGVAPARRKVRPDPVEALYAE